MWQKSVVPYYITVPFAKSAYLVKNEAKFVLTAGLTYAALIMLSLAIIIVPVMAVRHLHAISTAKDVA